jgi:hypothetical protein
LFSRSILAPQKHLRAVRREGDAAKGLAQQAKEDGYPDSHGLPIECAMEHVQPPAMVWTKPEQAIPKRNTAYAIPPN